MSTPSRTTRAPCSAATASRTPSTSSVCSASTTVAPSLMIPDFSEAISTTVCPRNRSWSSAIGVTTATSPSATLVESQLPPRPTSMTATSTGASANAANAITVNTSKNDSRGSPFSREPWSTRCTYGATSCQTSTNRSSLSGSPSIAIRSVTRDRCGLVNRPVRRPCSRSRRSTMRDVDVLPLVPVRCTTRYAFCGSPSSSQTARTRSRVGSMSCSGARLRMAW